MSYRNLWDLWKDNRIYDLYREAKERLDRDFNRTNMAYLLKALEDLGDVRKMDFYLKLWREKVGDDSFLPWELYVAFFSCDTERLKGILSRTENLIIKADILASYFGKTDEALHLLNRVEREGLNRNRYPDKDVWKLALESVRVRIRSLRGEEVNVDVGVWESELGKEVMLSMKVYLMLSSGEFAEYDELYDDELKKHFSKGALVGILRLMRPRAFVDGDAMTLEMLLNTYEDLGDRFSYLLTKMNLSLVRGENLLEEKDLPPECEVLRTHYNLMRAYLTGDRYVPPSQLLGLGDTWWYANRRIRNLPYLSFARKLRLYHGKKEVKFRSRRVVVALAFVRLLGKEEALRHLNLIFPGVRNPKKRFHQALSYLGRYLYVPTDAPITLRRGNFLREEREEWASFLKSSVSSGRISQLQ